MATSSIWPAFSMLLFPSTRNLKHKQINSNNAVKNTVEFCVDCSLKIKSQAHPVLNDEIQLPSQINSLQENEMVTPLVKTERRSVKDGLILERNICVRSFEIDPEYKLSTKSIMNYLQDISLNYATELGLAVTRFGITPEMRRMDLVWVFRDMCIEVDRYPCWGDAVKILHWTGLRFYWTINDIDTGEILVRASCLAVMMNKKTRKTCKFPEEVKDEFKGFLRTDSEPIIQSRKYLIPRIETMEHIKDGLTPGWNDLDVNYHVNNAKYLDWILESIPNSILYNHELRKISLEFRKECLNPIFVSSGD